MPIVTAAEKSLVVSLLPGFSEGYRQMLGRRSIMASSSRVGSGRSRARAGLHPRRPDADSGRAHRVARCAGRVRSLPSVRTRGREMAVVISIASPRSGWPTASSCWNMAPWSRMAPTRRWSRKAVCMPLSSRYRPRGIGKSWFDTPLAVPRRHGHVGHCCRGLTALCLR